jgi:integrase/recombinase XerD
MTIREAIAQHMDALELRNYASRTRINRAYQLRFLDRYLMERTPPVAEIGTVTGEILIEFQHWLYHRPTPKGTARGVANQNRILTGVRCFFTFLKAGGHLTANPAEILTQAREPRTLPRNVLTQSEARRILEGVDTGTAHGHRDRTVLEVFYATGIRKAELLALRVADVNLEEELLRIEQGKGGRDRMVPLSRIACHCLQIYLRTIRPTLLRGRMTDRLFLSARGRPLDRNVLGELVIRYARQVKIPKHITCHVWRHTCATHLLQNQASLRCIQEILGHRSLATTERYLHLTIADLKEAHRKYHPREKSFSRMPEKAMLATP